MGTAYRNREPTMSVFDATELPGDPMGQGPFGVASNWPLPGCHFLQGTIGSQYPIPMEYGSWQRWVTGPKGQNFAEGDNYASYNNVGYWGQVWPASFATPRFQLAVGGEPAPSVTRPQVTPLSTGHGGDFSSSDVMLVLFGTVLGLLLVFWILSGH